MTAAADVPRVESCPAATAGFDAFYRASYPRAKRLAWLLGGAEIAEDLAQDAFVSVEGRFDGLDDPTAYLMKTLVNRARTWRRDEQRRRVKHDRARDQTATVVLDDPADTDLLAAVAVLPYRQRAVVASWQLSPPVEHSSLAGPPLPPRYIWAPNR